MREMRESGRQIVLFVFVVIIFGIGVWTYLKKRPGDTLATSSPQQLDLRDPPRELASPEDQTKANTSQVQMNLQIPMDEKDADENTKETPPVAESGGVACTRMEYKGSGVQRSRVSEKDWKFVIDQFHLAKKLLRTWLLSVRHEVPGPTFAFFATQLEKTSLIRPPSVDVPDLDWRGIGLWTRSEKGMGMIRLSSGFVRLMVKAPKRGLFEITRLVAQSWAPCELERAGLPTPWTSLLGCLDVKEPKGCGPGSYSESGWAVSSGLAARLVSPGCSLPVFNEGKKQECLVKHLVSSNKGEKK